jgi:hypothetical protein
MKLHIDSASENIARILTPVGNKDKVMGLIESGEKLWALIYKKGESGDYYYELVNGNSNLITDTKQINRLLIDAINKNN